MKHCSVCKQLKIYESFYKDVTHSDGYMSRCVVCYEKVRARRPKKEVLTPVVSRECTVCLVTKDSSCFDKNKRSGSGLTSACKECRKIKSRSYYELKREEIKAKNGKHYREVYKERGRETRRAYQKRRMKEDPLYVMTRRLRNRLYYAMLKKFWKKNTKFFQYIGCTLEELKAHIESLFQPGMTWDNRSEWHLDHKIPLVSAKTEEELYKLCHYTNIQPLWGADNLSKGAKNP